MDQDTQHLQVLAIFHYVLAGLAALFSLLPVVHLVMGVMMMSGGFDSAGGAGDREAERLFGGLLAAFAALFIALGLTFAACLVAAGRFLARRTRYTFCLVMAAIECVFMPFGTVLGVFTILVLARDSVKVAFGLPVAAPPSTAQAGLLP
jgi:hypothetical protein